MTTAKYIKRSVNIHTSLNCKLRNLLVDCMVDNQAGRDCDVGNEARKILEAHLVSVLTDSEMNYAHLNYLKQMPACEFLLQPIKMQKIERDGIKHFSNADIGYLVINLYACEELFGRLPAERTTRKEKVEQS